MLNGVSDARENGGRGAFGAANDSFFELQSGDAFILRDRVLFKKAHCATGTFENICSRVCPFL
jgi:hypothetical protein